MAFSKRSTYIAITVMAALSLEVGCGDGSKKAPIRPQKTIATNVQTTKMQPKLDANGKPMKDPKTGKILMEPVKTANKPALGPDGKPVADKDLAVPETDPNLKKVADYEAELIKTASSNTSRAEELVAGTYELDTITTSAKIMGGNAGEETRAIQEDKVINQDGAYTLQSDTALSGGMIPNFTDTERQVDIPVKFTVTLDGGKWTPKREQANNLTFVNLVTTEANGKAKLNDSFRKPAVLTAGLFNFLTNGTLQKDNSYFLKDEEGKTMVARFTKGQGTLGVFLTFEELRAVKIGTQNTSFDRNIFLLFKVTPAAATANPADDKIHVTNVETLPGAATATPGATAAPAPAETAPAVPAAETPAP